MDSLVLYVLMFYSATLSLRQIVTISYLSFELYFHLLVFRHKVHHCAEMGRVMFIPPVDLNLNTSFHDSTNLKFPDPPLIVTYVREINTYTQKEDSKDSSTHTHCVFIRNKGAEKTELNTHTYSFLSDGVTAASLASLLLPVMRNFSFGRQCVALAVPPKLYTCALTLNYTAAAQTEAKSAAIHPHTLELTLALRQCVIALLMKNKCQPASDKLSIITLCFCGRCPRLPVNSYSCWIINQE